MDWSLKSFTRKVCRGICQVGSKLIQVPASGIALVSDNFSSIYAAGQRSILVHVAEILAVDVM
jgi:hypothetical protein